MFKGSKEKKITTIFLGKNGGEAKEHSDIAIIVLRTLQPEYKKIL